MENAIQQIEVQKALDLRKELEAIPYGDMKKEFTALGIEKVFTPGTKKEVLISRAIAALEKLEKAPIVEEVEEVVEKEVRTSALIARLKEGGELENEVVEEESSEKPVYSKDIILENLENIALALPNTTDSSKLVLVTKQDMLVKMLKQYERWEKLQK
jgi:hypothetical protein